jgi:hypothetical protein
VGGDGTEGGGEESCGELEGGALGLRDQATGQDGGERELVAELPVELGVEVVGGLAGEERLRGEATAMQREGEAVAGEGRDDGGLVADGPQVFGKGVAAEEAVGDGADGERAREERFGPGEAGTKVRGFAEEGCECVPTAAGVAEEMALDDEAEVSRVLFRGIGRRKYRGLSTALRFGRDDRVLVIPTSLDFGRDDSALGFSRGIIKGFLDER